MCRLGVNFDANRVDFGAYESVNSAYRQLTELQVLPVNAPLGY